MCFEIIWGENEGDGSAAAATTSPPSTRPKLKMVSQEWYDKWAKKLATPPLFTLVMYDPDAKKPNYLHYYVTNIGASNLKEGEFAKINSKHWKWVAPHPPPGEKHRYKVELILQKGGKVVEPDFDYVGRANWKRPQKAWDGALVAQLLRVSDGNVFV